MHFLKRGVNFEAWNHFRGWLGQVNNEGSSKWVCSRSWKIRGLELTNSLREFFDFCQVSTVCALSLHQSGLPDIVLSSEAIRKREYPISNDSRQSGKHCKLQNDVGGKKRKDWKEAKHFMQQPELYVMVGQKMVSCKHGSKDPSRIEEDLSQTQRIEQAAQ